MILKIQILGLLFSLLFGFLFSLVLSLNNKFIYNSKAIIKLIFSLAIVVVGVLGYFLLLKNIIEGVFHIYFIFALLLGAYIESILSMKVANKQKKWYTFSMIGRW